MLLRRGREFYGKKYDEAIALYSEGKDIKGIAKQLGVSYSAAYHWVKGLRKPELGNANEFIAFLKLHGPAAAVHVMHRFPKHNELFLIAARRSLPIKRAYLGKEYKELSTWYFLPGQEQVLDARIKELQQKINNLKNTLKSMTDR